MGAEVGLREQTLPDCRPHAAARTAEDAFRHWIEQLIERGIPTGYTEADYWDCLYLSKEELNSRESLICAVIIAPQAASERNFATI